MTLADGLRAKEKDIAAVKEDCEHVEGHAHARLILHRLLSSTNRRMHKGFPDMLTYLLRRPMEYSSHQFVHVSVALVWRKAIATVHAGGQRLQHRRQNTNNDDVLSVSEKPLLLPDDYRFRPRQLGDFPL